MNVKSEKRESKKEKAKQAKEKEATAAGQPPAKAAAEAAAEAVTLNAIAEEASLKWEQVRIQKFAVQVRLYDFVDFLSSRCHVAVALSFLQSIWIARLQFVKKCLLCAWVIDSSCSLM